MPLQPRYVSYHLYCSHSPILTMKTSLVSCGHTFCAVCIREHFRQILKKNIAAYRQEKGISVDLPFPTTSAERKELSALIKFSLGDPRRIFFYNCPQCRGNVMKAPVVAYQLRSLLSETRVALSEHLNDETHTDDLPNAFFHSLFE